MIHIIITSYGEDNLLEKSIKAFLSQNVKEEYKLIVVSPYEKTKEFIRKKFKNKIDFFLDPGEGKSYALNVLLEKIYSSQQDIIISTDGDVYVSKNSLKEIISAFEDEKIGCVSGRPVSLDSRKSILGYFSNIAFQGIHNTRKRLSEQGRFFECSGYLFAFRNGVLQGFPLEASEDAIIPYLFWKKSYKIKYAEKAEVYVLNNYTWKSYVKQKIRNIKGHENLNKIAPDMPRTKSFFNEIKEGFFLSLFYPKNFREIFYTLLMFPVRLYLYLRAFYDIKIKNKTYVDGWRGEN